MECSNIHDQCPLVQAVFQRNVEEVTFLLDHKEDVNSLDQRQSTPLHAAAYLGDVQIMDLLITSGANINTKDQAMLTPLHRAAASRNEKAVQLLLKHRVEVNARDKFWHTPLHVAAANWATGCAEALIPHVCSMDVLDISGRTPLHHAAYSGHSEMVNLLLSRGATITAKDKKERQPIHWASFLGHVDVVKLLISHRADVMCKDKHGYTPLHAAAAGGQTDTVKYLLKLGVRIDEPNTFGNTALHIASQAGHDIVASELVNCGANVNQPNNNSNTPLHLAATSSSGVMCLELLINNGADVNMQNKEGKIPLHLAAMNGCFTGSQILIQNGGEIDCVDIYGNTALHVAARFGQELLVSTLLTNGANKVKQGIHGMLPLHLAALHGFPDSCRKLLSNGLYNNVTPEINCQSPGFDINSQDDYGRTCLHAAASGGNVDSLNLLISCGADLDIKDHLGRSPLHYATANGNSQATISLVRAGAEVNDADLMGCSPLHYAAAASFIFSDGMSTDPDYGVAKEHEASLCLDFLLDNGADPTLKNSRGYSSVHFAAAYGNKQHLELLLEVSFNCLEEVESNIPVSPLHLAAYNGHCEALRLLCETLVSLDVRDIEGQTALHLAAHRGFASCVEVLLKHQASYTVKERKHKWTALHAAAAEGQMDCLLLLVNQRHSTDILDSQDTKGQTALMLAALGCHTDCVHILLEKGACADVVDNKGFTALHRSATLGSENCVSALLEHGASPLCRDAQGRTPLHLAASGGHTKQLLCLLKEAFKSDPLDSMLDYKGYTPTHWAAYHGHEECLRILLEYKPFNIQEGNAFSPLHCALINGHDAAAGLIVKTVGPKIVKIGDAKGRTPLHAAAFSGSVTGLHLVLSQGADINAVNHCGRSALMVAASCGHTVAVGVVRAAWINRYAPYYAACLRYFLPGGGESDSGHTRQNPQCEKPLRHSTEPEYLLHSGKTDLTLMDVHNNTALHLACSKGHEMCALLILAEINDSSLINAANSTLQMPLHIAARQGLATVVQVLLSRGAAVMAVDQEGRTPALACAPNKNVADCLAQILSSMKPFLIPESSNGPTPRCNPVLKNCSISASCGSTGGLCHNYAKDRSRTVGLHGCLTE